MLNKCIFLHGVRDPDLKQRLYALMLLTDLSGIARYDRSHLLTVRFAAWREQPPDDSVVYEPQATPCVVMSLCQG